MTRVYYKYAIAAVIVFDLSRPATFEAVLKWRDDVNSKVVLANGEPIPALLLANKCDLPGVTVNADQLNSFCAQHGFIGWFQTSAQDNVNIGKLSLSFTLPPYSFPRAFFFFHHFPLPNLVLFVLSFKFS